MKPIKLRNARLSDLAQIGEWHQAQNERDNTSYPLSLRFNPNGTLHASTPLALVGEDSDGVARGSLYIERGAELMFAGCDPKMTAFARRDIESLATWLYWQGYRALHCSVPLSVVASIRSPLEAAGFVQTDDRLAHFYKDLEG